MNTIIKSFLLISAFSYPLLAEDDSWDLQRGNIYFEDDLFSKEDSDYSAGERFSLLYYVPEPEGFVYDLLLLQDEPGDTYVGFSLGNQIYTPEDISDPALIPDDRPYAGWTYFESSINKSTKTQLSSLSVKIGIVGPASGSEFFQNKVHELTDSTPAVGWDNQLNNELGLNFKYTHKWRYSPDKILGVETVFIPFAEADLGNVAIKATAGLGMRMGYNIAKDFGGATINAGGESGVPIYEQRQNMNLHPWSFSVDVAAGGAAIARDIFLDGNTFSDSHSVEKENFVVYVSVGMIVRYKRFTFEFTQGRGSKKYKLQEKPHTVGSVLVAWNF